MATLTRDEMRKVIQEGGSVLWQGHTLTRLEQLPSEAQLAQGDPEKEHAATESLQTQIAQLQAQLAQLQPPAEPTPAKASKKKPAPADPTDEGDDTPPTT